MASNAIWDEAKSRPDVALCCVLMACELYYKGVSPITDEQYEYLLKFIQSHPPSVSVNLTKEHFSTSNLYDLVPESIKPLAAKWADQDLSVADIEYWIDGQHRG